MITLTCRMYAICVLTLLNKYFGFRCDIISVINSIYSLTEIKDHDHRITNIQKYDV